MTRHHLIALILLCALAVFAQSTDIRGTTEDASRIGNSGNDFLRVCSNESITNTVQAFCLGYVHGVLDRFESDPTPQTIVCEPASVTFGQQHSIVVKFIRDHPDVWHEHTGDLIALAIMRAFPCPKK
jgi:hypothetical protein